MATHLDEIQPNTYFRLMNDIDATETRKQMSAWQQLNIRLNPNHAWPAGFLSIGLQDKPFNSTLLGDGHKIIGLHCCSILGSLFYYIGESGVVTDLGIENAAAIAMCNYWEIENCYSTMTVQGELQASGLIRQNSGTVRECYNRGDVTCKTNRVAAIVLENSGTVQQSGSTRTAKGKATQERCWLRTAVIREPKQITSGNRQRPDPTHKTGRTGSRLAPFS